MPVCENGRWKTLQNKCKASEAVASTGGKTLLPSGTQASLRVSLSPVGNGFVEQNCDIGSIVCVSLEGAHDVGLAVAIEVRDGQACSAAAGRGPTVISKSGIAQNPLKSAVTVPRQNKQSTKGNTPKPRQTSFAAAAKIRNLQR